MGLEDIGQKFGDDLIVTDHTFTLGIEICFMEQFNECSKIERYSIYTLK